MLKLIRPNLHLDSVFELSADRLRGLGIDALLLDMDNTLKDYSAAAFSPAVKEWIESLRRAGVRMCILSNGKRHRVEPLAQQLGIPFVTNALKPFPFRCRSAARRLGVPPGRTAMVGDQLFADVLAGRLAGLYTILVRPTSADEPWFTSVKRPLERRVLRWMDSRPEKPTARSAHALASEPADNRSAPACVGAEPHPYKS